MLTQPVSYVFLTDAQYIVAFTLALISCLLSLFGSTSIIYLVVKRRNIWNDEEEVQHRLVLGLSIMDVITSSIIFVAPYINREDTGLPFARGNISTCEFGGFLFQFLSGSTFYNCLLSIYFVRTIRYSKTASAALFNHERLFHVIAFCIPITVGIAGVVTKAYNPTLLTGVCAVQHYPWNCLQNDSVESTWLVYWTIRQQAHKVNRRWSQSPQLEDVQRKRIRAVGIQAICYTAVFLAAFVSFLFLTVVREMYQPKATDASDLAGEPLVYAAVLLVYTFLPVQGFLNWLIYIRPRLIRWKDSDSDKSWLWAYRQVLSAEPAPITPRTSHLSSTRHLTYDTSTRNHFPRPSLPPVSEQGGDNVEPATTPLPAEVSSSSTNNRHSPPSRALLPDAERRFSGYSVQLPDFAEDE